MSTCLAKIILSTYKCLEKKFFFNNLIFNKNKSLTNFFKILKNNIKEKSELLITVIM